MRQVPHRLKEGIYQVADQVEALVRCGGRFDRVLKALSIPTTAEAAMQIGTFAGVGFDGPLEETQGLIEADYQLWGHYVGAQRVGRTLDAFGQAQDEVVLVHLSRNVEDVADEGPSTALPCGRGVTNCRLAIVHDSSRRPNDPVVC